MYTYILLTAKRKTRALSDDPSGTETDSVFSIEIPKKCHSVNRRFRGVEHDVHNDTGHIARHIYLSLSCNQMAISKVVMES